MSHKIDESKAKMPSRVMTGRRMIKSSAKEITPDNVMDVLLKAISDHELNRSEIDYLYKYYRGNQPILNRVKDVRPKSATRL